MPFGAVPADIDSITFVLAAAVMLWVGGLGGMFWRVGLGPMFSGRGSSGYSDQTGVNQASFQLTMEFCFIAEGND